MEIEAARKKNRNKNVERRLYVLVMRAEGKSLEEISEKTGYHISTASKLIARYIFEEEAAILSPFIERAERGEMVDIKEIAAAYPKAVPYKVSDTQIYSVLHRHGWRKVMPSSRPPKKQVRRL